jgi:hypothetical protein
MEHSKVIAFLLVTMHWMCNIESSRVGRHTTIERHSDVDLEFQVFFNLIFKKYKATIIQKMFK